jgi:hypothetical protein
MGLRSADDGGVGRERQDAAHLETPKPRSQGVIVGMVAAERFLGDDQDIRAQSVEKRSEIAADQNVRVDPHHLLEALAQKMEQSLRFDVVLAPLAEPMRAERNRRIPFHPLPEAVCGLGYEQLNRKAIAVTIETRDQEPQRRFAGPTIFRNTYDHLNSRTWTGSRRSLEVGLELLSTPSSDQSFLHIIW